MNLRREQFKHGLMISSIFSFEGGFNFPRVAFSSGAATRLERLRGKTFTIIILLKHYLKLNARVLSFNPDAQFSDVMDGLVLVDLLATSRTHLRQHLGNEGSAALPAWHGVTEEESGALCA